jgi:hypothetical protein
MNDVAKNTKIAVFWVVPSCSLVEVYQRFRGPCCLYHHRLVMEAARTSETVINLHQTTRRYNPEDGRLHTRRRENLKSCLQRIRLGIYVLRLGG